MIVTMGLLPFLVLLLMVAKCVDGRKLRFSLLQARKDLPQHWFEGTRELKEGDPQIAKNLRSIPKTSELFQQLERAVLSQTAGTHSDKHGDVSHRVVLATFCAANASVTRSQLVYP